MFEAVIWDFGGVITSSPFEAFNRYEAQRGLPRDFIRGINATNPDSNAWAQLESSSIDRDAFDALFLAESTAQGHAIPGNDVLALLAGELRPEMVNALGILKRHVTIGCITNNVRNSETPSARGKFAEVMDLFDVVIESSKVGIRKPNPEIYRMACDALGVAPSASVFLDDLGINLKPARALGMTTIKVQDANQALAELESHLGIALR